VPGEPPPQLRSRVASVLVSTTGSERFMLLKYSPVNPVPFPTAAWAHVVVVELVVVYSGG